MHMITQILLLSNPLSLLLTTLYILQRVTCHRRRGLVATFCCPNYAPKPRALSLGVPGHQSIHVSKNLSAGAT